jgi:flagellar motor switch protein FliG
VAIVCMALGSDAAAKLTQKMTPEDVDAISFEIARMDNVSGAAVESVLDEWLARMLAADSLASGGLQVAREILEKAFGTRKAGQVLERIQSQLTSSAGLHRLRNADPQQLGNMVRGEHPQTIALILAHLDPQHTASVLKELDTEVGSEVVYRIARMEKVSPEVIQIIERSLGSETELNVAQGMSYVRWSSRGRRGHELHDGIAREGAARWRAREGRRALRADQEPHVRLRGRGLAR